MLLLAEDDWAPQGQAESICFRTSTVAIKRRSRVPGVMITQFVEEVPEGMSTPDFTRKPIALTIQEGKLAFFKSMVSGVPKPNITWARNKGPLEDPVKYISRYDETMEEYFLEIPNVRAEQADTYKCFAANEYGRAVCTATLNVIEVGFKKKATTGPKRAAPEDFRKMLKRKVVRTKPQLKKKEGEIDPKFWEVLLSSPKKDYEKVCIEYGVSDFRWMLKQLNLKKKEREEEQAKVVEKIDNLKHIEVKTDGSAEFELDMELKNPNSQVFLFKDGVMVPYSDDGSGKHNLNKIGKKYIFSINDLMPDDAGLYQVDVEDANCFSTDFKIIPVEFVVKIQEVKAKEREDAMFECVLSHPFQKIVWTGKKIPLEQGDKFDITVSEDHLIHSLKVKDCAQVDKGVYTAMAGITSCNAWLIVEADNDPNMRGGKASRKTTTAGGGGENLAKIAAEQSAKLQKEKDDLDAARRAQAEKDAADAARQSQAEKDAADAARRAQAEKDAADAARRAQAEKDAADAARRAQAEMDPADAARWAQAEKDAADAARRAQAEKDAADAARRAQAEKDAADAAGAGEGDGEGHGGVQFLNGLADITGSLGETAELSCKLSHENCEGVWLKDGQRLTNEDGLKIIKDGASHKLVIENCKKDDAGVYSFEVDGHKSEARFTVSGAQFVGCGLSDIEVKFDETAELSLTLSSPNVEGFWFKDGKEVARGDRLKIIKEGANHKLVIDNCKKDDAGIYHFEVDGRKSKATLTVQGAQFSIGLSDVDVKLDATAELLCEVSSLNIEGVWYKHGKQVTPDDRVKIITDGACHKLVIDCCRKDDGAVYRFEVDGRISEATLTVQPVQFILGVADVQVKICTPAELSCKLSSANCKGIWYKDGFQVPPDDRVKIIKEGACHKLVIDNCKNDDSGVYHFEVDGRISEGSLTVQNPPTFNMDSLREFSKPVIVRACETAEWKLAFSGGDPMKIKWIKEDEELLEGLNVKIEQTDIKASLCITDCQRRNCGEVKINIKNDYGTLEATSRLIVLDKPTPPQRPVEIVETSLTAIEFKWKPPKDDGGCPVKHYILERQQVGGSKTWTNVGELPNDPLKYRDTNVKPGKRYCYNIRAKNEEGVSNALETEDIQAGILCYPGPPSAPKVVSAFKDCINLVWSPPINTGGTETWGYNLERRKKGSNFWSPANLDGPIKDTTFAVKDVIEGAAYEFRVSAINISGVGEPSPPSVIVFARDPKMRPQFTGKMKSFMVVRKGNTVRFNINFEASPLPDIYWLKDCVPLSKRVTITNSDRGSQLLIPTSERSDTGIFTIIVKNMVGQETFSVEIRVTDDPKPPGPVELEQNVPGTVTVTWTPSPDEKKDDRLHYVVYKRDSVKRTWRMVADSLFNHKFTVINILPGREYNFRVFAKNDMGLSEPAVSPTWSCNSDNFILDVPDVKGLDLQCPPSFLLRLKIRTAPPGYECYMSCAVRGNPKPHVTWYHNNVSLNTNTNYLITNVCGVCTMLILKIGPKDSGDYSVIADSPLGRAECSTKLTVRE
ncbi:immunoglobulin-like and fibronectin type III domain-containing protein 1 [Oncorhynchus keta]|uniref:immunoglobulin-like and fibronectin type III domain-containing protein 1 n=1 Tax=Oncorhynchus keta TaxID=8018 RepID=UPI00227B33EE|nr:immunoglobulin-like and fibronectin type III domain-containing protein 1 [Oncorhynchus keta]